jgi:hypothetical protein
LHWARPFLHNSFWANDCSRAALRAYSEKVIKGWSGENDMMTHKAWLVCSLFLATVYQVLPRVSSKHTRDNREASQRYRESDEADALVQLKSGLETAYQVLPLTSSKRQRDNRKASKRSQELDVAEALEQLKSDLKKISDTKLVTLLAEKHADFWDNVNPLLEITVGEQDLSADKETPHRKRRLIQNILLAHATIELILDEARDRGLLPTQDLSPETNPWRSYYILMVSPTTHSSVQEQLIAPLRNPNELELSELVTSLRKSDLAHRPYEEEGDAMIYDMKADIAQREEEKTKAKRKRNNNDPHSKQTRKKPLRLRAPITHAIL